jgi:UDP-N-acetylglucosamine/UDP-N-acetylgalactosamine diphosphorylase
MSESVRQTFDAAGQGHVFRFFDRLSPSSQASLLRQAAGIDLAEIDHLVRTLVRGTGGSGAAAKDYGGIAPAPYIPLPGSGGDAARWREAAIVGESALRAGRVAAFTVAGGQGTRLGFDGPKGTFPVTPVAGKTLFQVFAEKILAASRRYGRPIPWFIMTSDINHDATVAFFEEHRHFGLDPAGVRFFSQGLMPAVTPEGKILLSAPDQIALSPDGHGGSLRALVRNGCTARMEELGIDLLSYFQVDNPLVRPLDPAFLGFHLLEESEASSKTCLKAYPEEKVGVFVSRDGVLEVLEYSDLPAELVQARDADGQIRFRAGSIAIHVFSRALVERMGAAEDPALRLPFHLARKKVPTVDDQGNPVEPEAPNGIKFEMFVFDALPFARNPLVVETARSEEFSPVKNAAGNDSPQTCREDQLRQFARWARAAGHDVPVDATGLPDFPFEISPLFADSAEAFAARGGEAVLAPGAVLG